MFLSESSNEHFQEHDSFMSLPPGNPVHSLSVSQGPSSSFLPDYLLDDNHTHHHAVSNTRLWSTGMNYNPVQKGMGYNGSLPVTSSGQDVLRREQTRPKVAAPPVKGLFSSSTEHDTSYTDIPSYSRTHSLPALRRLISTTSAPPTSGLCQTSEESLANKGPQMKNESQTVPASSVQSDQFSNQGNVSSDAEDETWVTVFGFPQGGSSFILQQFSLYGTILKYIIPPDCNWMHIHYLTKIQAQKALSKDGKIYGGCMKIGVTQCTKKSVMEEKKSLQSVYTGSAFHSMATSQPDLSSSGSRTPIRPLMSTYAVAGPTEYEMLQGKPTPQRDASLLSKLKEYMFGY